MTSKILLGLLGLGLALAGEVLVLEATDEKVSIFRSATPTTPSYGEGQSSQGPMASNKSHEGSKAQTTDESRDGGA